jgi:uncharacterized protein
MPKRFIAGAVCPRCGEQDKLTVDTETDLRECVKCDFSEKRPQEGGSAEIKTRVNRPAARRSETPAQVITLVDPSEDQ